MYSMLQNISRNYLGYYWKLLYYSFHWFYYIKTHFPIKVYFEKVLMHFNLLQQSQYSSAICSKTGDISQSKFRYVKRISIKNHPKSNDHILFYLEIMLHIFKINKKKKCFESTTKLFNLTYCNHCSLTVQFGSLKMWK